MERSRDHEETKEDRFIGTSLPLCFDRYCLWISRLRNEARHPKDLVKVIHGKFDDIVVE